MACGLYLESYKVVPKRNYLGAYGFQAPCMEQKKELPCLTWNPIKLALLIVKGSGLRLPSSPQPTLSIDAECISPRSLHYPRLGGGGGPQAENGDGLSQALYLRHRNHGVLNRRVFIQAAGSLTSHPSPVASPLFPPASSPLPAAKPGSKRIKNA